MNWWNSWEELSVVIQDSGQEENKWRVSPLLACGQGGGVRLLGGEGGQRASASYQAKSDPSSPLGINLALCNLRSFYTQIGFSWSRYYISFRWRFADLNNVCLWRLISDAGKVSGEFNCSSGGLPLQIWRRRVYFGSSGWLHFWSRRPLFECKVCLWSGAKYAKEVGILCCCFRFF